MKRNGFLNLLRVTFKDFIHGKKMYEEIVPRNYFHALQMNNFSIDKSNDPSAETLYFDFPEDFELTETSIEYFENKGGIIVFSTEINAVSLSKRKLINYIYSKIQSIKNSMFVNKKIETIFRKHESLKGVGMTVGSFVNGKYVADDGTIYTEKSISVEIIGVPTSVLNEVADSIRKEFNQEAVLVRNYEENLIYLVK